MLHFNLLKPDGPFKTSDEENMGARNGNGRNHRNGLNSHPPAWEKCPVKDHCFNNCYQCPSTCKEYRQGNSCAHPEASCLSCEEKYKKLLGLTYYPEKQNGKENNGHNDSSMASTRNSFSSRSNGPKTHLPIRNKTEKFLEKDDEEHAE